MKIVLNVLSFQNIDALTLLWTCFLICVLLPSTIIKNPTSSIPKNINKSEFDLQTPFVKRFVVAFAKTSIFRYTSQIISDRKRNIFEVALFANLTFYCIMLNSTKEVTNITSINHPVAYLRRQNKIT